MSQPRKPSPASARCATNGTIEPVKVYCDSNILIAALEGTREPSDHLDDLFKSATRKQVSLVTSALSPAETLVKPLEIENRELVAAYATLLSNDRRQQIETIEIDRNILAQAAFVRVRKMSIKLPDAIHIATAEQSGCEDSHTRSAVGGRDTPSDSRSRQQCP